MDHVPSDLRGYWHLLYGIRPGQISKFKENLKHILSTIEQDPAKSDNPVADYLAHNDIQVSRYAQKESIRKLYALWTELSGNRATLLKFYDRHKNASSKKSDVGSIFSGCLALLLETYYVDLGPTIFADAYELFKRLAEIAREGVDTSQALEIIKLINTLMDRIRDVRVAMEGGTFSEPHNPSLMIWSGPSQGPAPQSRCEALLTGYPMLERDPQSMECTTTLDVSPLSNGPETTTPVKRTRRGKTTV
jgi:hypothetical protein